MKIKHKAFTIEAGKPFENCKLNRAKYAEALTEIVQTYVEGMVLAIDNEWGTGKTTFVRMWQQHLIDNGFRTVYFNAWENDFDANALVAILSELKTLTNEGSKEIFDSVVGMAAILAKNVLPGVLKALAAKYVDLAALQATIEDTAKGVTEIFEKELEAHAAKKKTIQDFKTVLEKFIKIDENQKPLIFFVDELDRCRPSYSVEVLEQLKHLFSVPGIVFVLSVDKKQLAHAVRGYYGSDQINGEEYLRRFIDLDCTVPRPSNQEFCSYMIQYFGIDHVVRKARISPDQKDFFIQGVYIRFAGYLFDLDNVTLRQQERIFGLSRLAMNIFGHRNVTVDQLIFFLVYVKAMQPQVFSKIEQREYSLQELSDTFSEMFRVLPKIEDIDLGLIYSLLLRSYAVWKHGAMAIDRIYKKDTNKNLRLSIHPKFKEPIADYYIAAAYEKLEDNSELSGFQLESVMLRLTHLSDVVR